MTQPSRLAGRLLAVALLLFATACDRSRAEPRVLVFGAPDAANREMVSALARAARAEGLELRMTTDPSVVVQDSLATYRGFVLLNTSADLLDHRAQTDLERYVEAGGVFVRVGDQPARTWPWLEQAGGQGGIVHLTGAGDAAQWADPAFAERLDEAFARIAEGAPRFASGAASGIPDSTRFEQQILVDGPLDEPTEIAITSDGRVFFVERRGAVRLYEPGAEGARLVHQFDVFTEEENGLIGITLDPAFDENGWMYITRTVGDTLDARHLVSRFTYGDAGLSDERPLFDVPIDRGCCHTGGSMTFDPDGNLYVSFGDNTNPFATSYAPIDDRPGRALWDARRSSANTQDLRGKIVRIRPQPDGTYTIPEGNLFSDPAEGRPEIYTMGHRNPYRISVDPETRFVYWGEVGPDARLDSIAGPIGYDEVNQARQAGNFGWPLFIGDNFRYRDLDPATGQYGELFDPAAPINDSRFNTGATQLPPAQPAMIYYPYAASEEFPRVGEGGRTAMAGPVYRASLFEGSDQRLPDYYDGKFIFYEWIRGWMMAATLDDNGDLVSMEPFLDHLTFDHPMDVELGPDGSLYVLEYGTVWFAPNPGARLSRIVYNDGNRRPRAVISANPSNGAAPLEVELSAAGSSDPDGDRLSYRWEMPDGTVEGETARYTLSGSGEQPVRLIVTDRGGRADTATTTVTVGNAPADLAIEVQGNRTFFWEGQPLDYHVTATDAEDGTLGSGIDPERVRLTVDYQARSILEATPLGHQTEQTPPGLLYIQQGDCVACHNVDQASAGPSYRSVAERYASEPGMVRYLMNKIIQGGSGVWGEQVMPAHPDLRNDVVREMVRYIMSLATPGETLPLSGALALDRHERVAGDPAGAYLLTAAYVDRGGAGVAPFEQRTQLVLRSPVVRAADVAERWGMGVGAEGDSTSTVRIEADRARLELGSIDLTGVGAVHVELADVAGDVTFELRSGAADGSLIGSAEVAPGSGDGAVAVIPVSQTGEAELFLVARTDDPLVGPWTPAASIRSLRFEPAAE